MPIGDKVPISDKFLRTDIHALARSARDGTPAIPHAVLTLENTIEFSDATNNGRDMKWINKDEWRNMVIDNADLPEGGTTRDWNMDYVCVPQVEKLAKVEAMKGQTHFSVEYLKTFKFYHWKNMRQT